MGSKSIFRFAFFIFVFLFSFSEVFAQTAFPCPLTPFAGNGGVGNTGDGGAATAASLSRPVEFTFDSAGNAYIISEHKVRKVDRNGNISTFAGTGVFGFFGDGGAATQAQLDEPVDIATDLQGNVYIADSKNGRIRKVDLNGIITTVAGNGNQGVEPQNGLLATSIKLGVTLQNYQNRMSGLTAITLDRQGNLYVALGDNETCRIERSQNIIKVDTSGHITLIPLPDDCPFRLKTDNNGNLYYLGETSRLGHALRDRIYKIDTNGNVTVVAGTGIRGSSGDGGLATSAQISIDTRFLSGLNGLALDLHGNLYFIEPGPLAARQNKLRKIDQAGIIRSYLITNDAAGYPISLSDIEFDKDNIFYGAGIFSILKCNYCAQQNIQIDDNNSCTQDSCIFLDGSILHDPIPFNGQTCSDSNICDGTSACSNGQCRNRPQTRPADGTSCPLPADPFTGQNHRSWMLLVLSS